MNKTGIIIAIIDGTNIFDINFKAIIKE